MSKNSITQKAITQQELKLLLLKESHVNHDGSTEFTRHGISRLTGKNRASIQYLLKKLLKEGANKSVSFPLQPFVGQSFHAGGQIPDSLVSAIVQHYAFNGDQRCQKILAVSSASGLRSLVQVAHNWQPVRQRTLSAEEIIDLCVLPVSTTWQRRFPEEYYTHLSRLTGLNSHGNLRPQRWAMLTKELVYDHLPLGIYTQIKKCKAETDSWDKLHQYLSEDGLKLLEAHQNTLLSLMAAAASLEQLKQLLAQSAGNGYQLLVFDRNPAKKLA